MSTTRGPISQFIEKNYLHFNAAALMDAAKGYETHLAEGGKMMITLAGAMSTAEYRSCRESEAGRAQPHFRHGRRRGHVRALDVVRVPPKALRTLRG